MLNTRNVCIVNDSQFLNTVLQVGENVLVVGVQLNSSSRLWFLRVDALMGVCGREESTQSSSSRLWFLRVDTEMGACGRRESTQCFWTCITFRVRLSSSNLWMLRMKKSP